jgi:hypothetical protein
MGLFPAAAVALFAGYHPPEPPPAEYVFVRDTDRWVGLYRGGTIYIGKLDADGKFHDSVRIDHNKRYSGMEREGKKYALISWPELDRLRPAYEYRAGTLVKGVINSDGVFVPDPEAPAIPFWQYKYSPTAPPIWNLPGTFQKKEPPGGAKAEKK